MEKHAVYSCGFDDLHGNCRQLYVESPNTWHTEKPMRGMILANQFHLIFSNPNMMAITGYELCI